MVLSARTQKAGITTVPIRGSPSLGAPASFQRVAEKQGRLQCTTSNFAEFVANEFAIENIQRAM